MQKKRKVHEVRHDLISSISWERIDLKASLVLGIFFILLGIGSMYTRFTGGYLFFTIMGAICIAIFFLYKPEYLAIYSAGRSMRINGPKETLEELMREAQNIRLK